MKDTTLFNHLRAVPVPKDRISSLGQQFMPVTKLRGLESGDHPGLRVDETHTTVTSSHAYDMDGLRKDVGEHGLQEPLMVDPDHTTLLNGHHRAHVAMEQGHMFVPVTSKHPADWVPKTYRRPSSWSQRPSRTWEPLIQEHENEADQIHEQRKNAALSQRMDFRQGIMFPDHGFTDRRARVKS
jgi:hypothetical protein